VLVGVELQALDDLGFQLAFLAAGLDGVQQGQHADRPSGRLGRAGSRLLGRPAGGGAAR